MEKATARKTALNAGRKIAHGFFPGAAEIIDLRHAETHVTEMLGVGCGWYYNPPWKDFRESALSCPYGCPESLSRIAFSVFLT
jgi:hypothetical protein